MESPSYNLRASSPICLRQKAGESKDTFEKRVIERDRYLYERERIRPHDALRTGWSMALWRFEEKELIDRVLGRLNAKESIEMADLERISPLKLLQSGIFEKFAKRGMNIDNFKKFKFLVSRPYTDAFKLALLLKILPANDKAATNLLISVCSDRVIQEFIYAKPQETRGIQFMLGGYPQVNRFNKIFTGCFEKIALERMSVHDILTAPKPSYFKTFILVQQLARNISFSAAEVLVDRMVAQSKVFAALDSDSPKLVNAYLFIVSLEELCNHELSYDKLASKLRSALPKTD